MKGRKRLMRDGREIKNEILGGREERDQGKNERREVRVGGMKERFKRKYKERKK
jgi:hypothetical protein